MPPTEPVDVLLARVDERTGHILKGQEDLRKWMLKHEQRNEAEFATIRTDLDDTDAEVAKLKLWRSGLVGAGTVLAGLWAIATAWLKDLF